MVFIKCLLFIITVGFSYCDKRNLVELSYYDSDHQFNTIYLKYYVLNPKNIVYDQKIGISLINTEIENCSINLKDELPEIFALYIKPTEECLSKVMKHADSLGAKYIILDITLINNNNIKLNSVKSTLFLIDNKQNSLEFDSGKLFINVFFNKVH